MKNKRVPVGQYTIENLGGTENSYDRIEELMPLIGEIVTYFNTLEAALDDCICSAISDRSDQKGLLVLSNMMYSTKVDLYKKFSDDFVRSFSFETPIYERLISDLKECGTLRNRVVHANWDRTDEEGYTQVRIRVGKEGLEHEMWQFSGESLIQIMKKIIDTYQSLDEFEQACEEKISEWSHEIAKRNQKKEKENCYNACSRTSASWRSPQPLMRGVMWHESERTR